MRRLRDDLPRDRPVELKGSVSDLLLAWGWLTLAICDHYAISEAHLAGKMPSLVADLRNALMGKATVDLGALEEFQQKKGDGHDDDA
ncbi:MAG: hypothetical protein HFF77_02770 [Oscillospiraceae bacterium]|nr:hypothetical protein [Oscillospiraceae bacterium]